MFSINDVLSQMGSSQWFSALDLQFGFWHIQMSPDDIKKTTIITKSGLYDWNVMSFKLKNATRTFSRTMVEVFKDWTNQFLKVSVDVINIHSQTTEEHLTHLKVVLTRLQEVNLKLNPGKCSFSAQQIIFLGYVVTKQGPYPDPKKVHVIKDFLVPRFVSNVRAFLGLIRYYKNFVRGYAKIVVPLFNLTKKDQNFLWTLVKKFLTYSSSSRLRHPSL
jgi:hypothetical protein